MSTGIRIIGAHRHNLANLDVTIPLSALVVLAGVSGSGKSTLMRDVLVPSLVSGVPTGCVACTGRELVGDVLCVHQGAESGGGSGSLVATKIGLFEPLGRLYAATPEARALKLSAPAFSPFSKQGRCETCLGHGHQAVSMDFLADIELICEECGGKRFRPDVLTVARHGLTVADVLDLTVQEAATLFHDAPAVTAVLLPLQRIGLDYLTLGRETATLSMGERQRLRLAEPLSAEAAARGSLIILDEPTTGLHPTNIATLLGLFDDLLDRGHSLLVLEHHLEVIRRADWLIELGPGAGPEGGRLVTAGPPALVAQHPASALRRVLSTHEA